MHIDGNMDIIISIPHGGTLNPSWIPNRRHAFQCGKKNHDDCPVVWVSDDFTIDLGFEIAQSIKMYCGREPHLIINYLKRPKLDPNREIHIGASRCYEVLEAFKQYHSLIDDTKRNFKHGLLIDLHGRGMDDGVTQIGYGINKMDLINNNYNVNQSSIQTLAKGSPGEDLITGEKSFGAFMEREGYCALPSPINPKPDRKEVYFSGGYITRHHGSSHVDAIQLETPSDLRINNSGERHQFAQAMGKAIVDFYSFHYSSSCSAVDSGGARVPPKLCPKFEVPKRKWKMEP